MTANLDPMLGRLGRTITVAPSRAGANIGPDGYCEYAAILARVVLGNPDLFA